MWSRWIGSNFECWCLAPACFLINTDLIASGHQVAEISGQGLTVSVWSKIERAESQRVLTCTETDCNSLLHYQRLASPKPAGLAFGLLIAATVMLYRACKDGMKPTEKEQVEHIKDVRLAYTLKSTPGSLSLSFIFPLTGTHFHSHCLLVSRLHIRFLTLSLLLSPSFTVSLSALTITLTVTLSLSLYLCLRCTLTFTLTPSLKSYLHSHLHSLILPHPHTLQLEAQTMPLSLSESYPESYPKRFDSTSTQWHIRSFFDASTRQKACARSRSSWSFVVLQGLLALSFLVAF